jgi:hypothetical protein
MRDTLRRERPMIGYAVRRQGVSWRAEASSWASRRSAVTKDSPRIVPITTPSAIRSGSVRAATAATSRAANFLGGVGVGVQWPEQVVLTEGPKRGDRLDQRDDGRPVR